MNVIHVTNLRDRLALRTGKGHAALWGSGFGVGKRQEVHDGADRMLGGHSHLPSLGQCKKQVSTSHRKAEELHDGHRAFAATLTTAEHGRVTSRASDEGATCIGDFSASPRKVCHVGGASGVASKRRMAPLLSSHQAGKAHVGNTCGQPHVHMLQIVCQGTRKWAQTLPRYKCNDGMPRACMCIACVHTVLMQLLHVGYTYTHMPEQGLPHTACYHCCGAGLAQV